MELAEAIFFGLITAEQADNMPTPEHLETFLSSPYSEEAIEKNIITPEQAAAMPSGYHLWALLQSEQSIQALREGLITPEQAAAMPTANHLRVLLQNAKSIQAIKDQFIYPEDIAQIPYASINAFVDDVIKNKDIFCKKNKILLSDLSELNISISEVGRILKHLNLSFEKLNTMPVEKVDAIGVVA